MMAIETSGCAILLQVVLVVGISQAAVFNINAVLNSGKNFAGLHPADDYPIREFVTRYGYGLESHRNIRTEDDYLLTLYRIPYGRAGPPPEGTIRPVVFLMHGLLGSCEDWVVQGPEISLAFLLAEQGYDVWMGNARGTLHSRRHALLNPDVDSSYWRFSWHEIGYYDLPASITYIQRTTTRTQIFYVGHSQGCTAFYTMVTMRPELNNVITLMVALAPPTYMANSPNFALRYLSKFHSFSFLFQFLGLDEVHPTNYLLEIAGGNVCHERMLTSPLCANLLFLIGGYDSVQLNRGILPEIVKYAPAGASTRQFIHYAQEITSGRFCRYDHGASKNLQLYGAEVPPAYGIDRITCPVAVYYAKNDAIVATQDVDRFCDELPNLAQKTLIEFEQFNHLDFVYATDAPTLLYNNVIEVMQSYAA